MVAPELAHLVRALSDHDIEVDRNEMNRAFESPSTSGAIKSWVRKYTSPANLMTKEELTFANKHGLGNNNQEATSRYITDEEYETAIGQLEASSAAIEKQCHLLEKQKQALQTIRARNASTSHAENTTSVRQLKLTRERTRLESDIDELALSIRTRLQANTKQAENATALFPSSTERLLEKDDRLLDGLNKIVPLLSGPNYSTPESDEVQALCQALTHLSAAEVRGRLEKAYLSAAEAVNSQPNGTANVTHEANPQVEALRTELDELCGEIDSLAAMAVENEYRLPITRALENARSEAEAERANWTEYTSAVLDYMAARLDILGDHSESLHAHCDALKTVSATFEGVVATRTHSSSVSNGVSTSGGVGSPTMREGNRKGLRLLRLVQANISEAQDPAGLLLRYFDLKAADPGDEARFAQDLAETVQKRKENATAQSSKTGQVIADLLSQSLAKVDRETMTLGRAVHAHSPYGPVRLVDRTVEEAITRLEGKTEDLSERMRGLDLDEATASVRNAQRALLANR